MAIEKQMEPSDLEIEETDAENIEVEIVNPDAVSIRQKMVGLLLISKAVSLKRLWARS